MSSAKFSDVEILRFPMRKSTFAPMVTRIGGKLPPRLFLQEWMEACGLDRKRLAERMQVSPGTITKKLNHPENVDMTWLMMFSEAFGRDDFRDLFRHPEAPTQAELMKGLDEATQRQIVNFVDFLRKGAGGRGS